MGVKKPKLCKITQEHDWKSVTGSDAVMDLTCKTRWRLGHGLGLDFSVRDVLKIDEIWTDNVFVFNETLLKEA